MKKIILATVVSISILSCKQEPTFDYKYADQSPAITCENNDTTLFNEAYYAFENAIVTQAKNNNRRPNFKITTDYALRSFIYRARGNMRITDFITQEAFDVFNVLKNKDIWDGIQLKNNAEITKCIGDNISNSNIKESFNTLLSVESLHPNLVASAIIDNKTVRDQYKDKVLMTYVALDMYYSKFFNTDLSNIEFLVEKDPTNEPLPSVKLNAPEIGKKLNLNTGKNNKQQHGSHDGHNH
ncbi:MAG: hypothetical protein ACPGU9_08840 [Flavobacteriaceae bacterium]